MGNDFVYLVSGFTAVIHFSSSVAYAVRIAGFREKRLAISFSLATTLLLISRLANLVQAPFLGLMVDEVIISGGHSWHMDMLESQFRLVIVFSAIGSLLGFILVPTFITVFRRVIVLFSEKRSMLKVLLLGMSVKGVIFFFSSIRFPKLSSFQRISLRNLPLGFLLLNVLVTGVFTVGVLSTLLAGAYWPEYRTTILQLSGIINGIGTILFTLFVDPQCSRILDEGLVGRYTDDDVCSMVYYLLLGKLLGTLILAQLLLKPFAEYILFICGYLKLLL